MLTRREPPWAIHGADHLAVRGLLSELPNLGEVFTPEDREIWLDAMRKLFALLYEPALSTGASSAVSLDDTDTGAEA